VKNRVTPLRVASGAFGAFAIGFVLFGLSGWGPPAANEQAIGEVSRWCERVNDGLLREPINTLGNLGFVAVGLLIFATLARDIERGIPSSNRFMGHDPVALLYGAAALFLGPGSMVMHGTHTRFGAWIDNLSMVAYILIPWLFNLARLGRWRDRTFFLTYAASLSLYGAGYWFLGPDLGIGLDLFGLSIALWIISEVLHRWWSPWLRLASGLAGFLVAAVFGLTPSEMLAAPGENWWVFLFWVPGLLARRPPPGRRTYTPWYWLGVASFLVAYSIWLTGTDTSTTCRPDSLFQAHAIWHLLTALATYCFFRFFRTERSSVPAGPVISSSV
jgi:predicted membrane channel-forming protein YqfA (hemolysin III family)